MILGYYEEMDYNNNDLLIRNLNKVISVIGYDRKKTSSFVNPIFDEDYVKHRVSVECLDEIEKSGDRQIATTDCSLLKFNNIDLPGVDHAISILLRGKIKKFGISGRIWYPKLGFMGWHTNSNSIGYRLYCVFAREGGKSFFRYKNPGTNEVVTSWDKEGWNFRVFRIDEKLLWHSIYSNTDRFSIGYTLHI